MAGPKTELLAPTAQGIARATDLICKGQLVAFPTETVYGLGALATDSMAVARVFEAKGRPSFNPLIVHVHSFDAAEKIGVFDDNARALANAFWPGPLTLVVPMKSAAGVADLVSAGLDTVAIRVPQQPLARDLLKAVGRPVAAPSANPSGRISPTEATHVIDGFEDGVIAAVLDGGPCAIGLESTILTTMPRAQLLRPGGLPVEAIEACLGHALETESSTGKITAPGQLASHYAPTTTVRLNAQNAEASEVMLGFGDVAGDLNLSPNGDLTEAAANLFGMLRALDAKGATAIAVAPIPTLGLGRAINDRLMRAAAPRGQA